MPQPRVAPAAILAVLVPLGAAALGTISLAPAARAQGYYPSQSPYPPPDGYGSRRGRAAEEYYGRGYGGRAAYPPPPPPQEERRFYWPWEDRPAQRPPPPPQPAPRYGDAPRYGYPDQPRPRGYADDARPAPRRRPPPQRVAAPPPPAPVKPKPNPTVQVAVFGDSLADLLGQGLEEAFADNADIGVTRKARADTGLVRKDVADWPKLAEDYIRANPKLTYAVVMFAANDRQAIRDGDQSVEVLTERWRTLYGERIDALLKVFADAKVPVLWVGSPPMKTEALSRDLAAMNDLDRERVQRAGGTYVDIWPAFVDDANRYTATGPDLDGRTTRLRLGDGVHFTHAGARKAAHFVDVEIKKLMGQRGQPTAPSEPVATAPSATLSPDAGAALEGGPKQEDAAAIDRRITASLPSLPEPPGIPALPVKPAAGPVVPLTRTELSPGGALITARPRLEGDAGRAIERSLVRGSAPATQPGRADDFKWPEN